MSIDPELAVTVADVLAQYRQELIDRTERLMTVQAALNVVSRELEQQRSLVTQLTEEISLLMSKESSDGQGQEQARV